MSSRAKTWFPAVAILLLLMLLLTWLYSPGTTGPGMLDDVTSVHVLDDLRDRPLRLRDVVFVDRAGPLGRPVAIATFALERWFSDAGMPLSKAINIGIHVANAFLLAVVFSLLLGVANGPSRILVVCILCAALWAVAPLFVSTVLYAVQRMAMLATFFMLLSILAYLWWRRSYCHGAPGVGKALVCMICIFLAVLSKETAVVILPILLCLESFWFRWSDNTGRQHHRLRAGSIALCLAGCCFILLAFAGFGDDLMGAYRFKDFTPMERLAAQAGILGDYVSQLVIPDTARMGLHHDDVTIEDFAGGDRSNLPGIAAWGSLLLIAPVFHGWELLSRLTCCALFFVFGHAVESTILPLELYYEHRNYFPAVGLFLGLALVLSHVLRVWPATGWPVAAYLGVVWLLYAGQTSALVQVWSSEPLLRMAHLIGHPRSYRANADMAVELASRGEVSAALDYSALAHELKNETQADYLVRNTALVCLAGAKQFPAHERLMTPAYVDMSGLRDLNTLRILVNFYQAGSCDSTAILPLADAFWAAFGAARGVAPEATDIYTVLAVLENALERYDKALHYTTELVQKRPDDVRGLLMRLHFAVLTGQRDTMIVTRDALLKLERDDRLTAEQMATLDLYREWDE